MPDIIPKLQNNSGMAIFAKERAKFEGWLKLELCENLSKHFKDAAPEIDRIDITFGHWGIELKIVNTNYRYPNVKEKTRPITMNVQAVVDDIEKLKSTNYPNKAILFIAFPVKHDRKDWQNHLKKISSSLKERKYKCKELNFKNGVPGVVYFGSI